MTAPRLMHSAYLRHKISIKNYKCNKEICCCRPVCLNMALAQWHSVLTSQTVRYRKRNRNISISWHKQKRREQHFSCCKLLSVAAGHLEHHPHFSGVCHTRRLPPAPPQICWTIQLLHALVWTQRSLVSKLCRIFKLQNPRPSLPKSVTYI